MNQLVQLKNKSGNVYPVTKLYIVEEGRNGDLVWRKWSNGFAEAWNTQYYNGSANFEAYGNIFRWNHPFKISFPEGLFKGNWFKVYNLNYNGYECLWLSSNGYGSTTTSQNIYIMAASKNSYGGLELLISGYAWGHWK